MFKSSNVKALLAIVLLAIAFSFASFAQVTAEMTASKIVLQGNKERRDAADKTHPGEIVEYCIVYKNTGRAPVKNVLATLPIPLGMELLPKSPVPAEFSVSVEGATYAKFPLKRMIVGPDGRTKIAEVPAADIRGIRWNIGELKAGESRAITARMRSQSAGAYQPTKSARK